MAAAEDPNTTTPSQKRRIGAWLTGARGSVATTTQVGVAALAEGLTEPIGVVSSLPFFAEAGLADFDEIVFGGHDTNITPLSKRAEDLAHSGVVHPHVVRTVTPVLDSNEESIRVPELQAPATRVGDTVAALAADIAAFRQEHQLDQVVVINLLSVEAVGPVELAGASAKELLATTAQAPASVLYAMAAFEAGAAFVDFTPSPATSYRAVQETAVAKGLPFAGRDGKTGETLVKAALAPMFANRNLRVRSWAGTNLLGGGDGATLSNPDAAASKLASKGHLLDEVLGYSVDAPLHIDYVPDLGEWKTAWDNISFEGFLGARMTMQFTWQGCDSSLAAPLVIDLIRLATLALERGESGPLGQLAFFFKDPVATHDHALDAQFARLVEWAQTAH